MIPQDCPSRSQQNSYQRSCTDKRPCPSCVTQQKKNWDRYLSHYKAGLIDSKNFLSYYLGKTKHGELQVPVDLLRVGIETEQMFSQLNVIYGPNHEMWCKDCNTKHIFWGLENWVSFFVANQRFDIFKANLLWKTEKKARTFKPSSRNFVNFQIKHRVNKYRALLIFEIARAKKYYQRRHRKKKLILNLNSKW